MTARTLTPSIDSDVLADLYADAWFTAQHDILTITAQPRPITATHPRHINDVWTGDGAEIHAFLALNPAF